MTAKQNQLHLVIIKTVQGTEGYLFLC
uniref:Uncharacterized protein n=1 Tax=Arundo donax TaxID=35708 RepID=A0A0A9FQH4_ARUDO